MKDNNDSKTSGSSGTGGQSRKSLRPENLRSRREFLKRAAKKASIPAIIIYSAHKMTPPAFGRTPI